MPEIETRIARARERIAAAAGRAGRSPAEVTLMAVTKTVGPPTVQAAVDAGARDIPGACAGRKAVASCRRLWQCSARSFFP